MCCDWQRNSCCLLAMRGVIAAKLHKQGFNVRISKPRARYFAGMPESTISGNSLLDQSCRGTLPSRQLFAEAPSVCFWFTFFLNFEAAIQLLGSRRVSFCMGSFGAVSKILVHNLWRSFFLKLLLLSTRIEEAHAVARQRLLSSSDDPIPGQASSLDFFVSRRIAYEQSSTSFCFEDISQYFPRFCRLAKEVLTNREGRYWRGNAKMKCSQAYTRSFGYAASRSHSVQL